MRSSKTILGLSAMALSLTACKTVMDPTFMPSGYTYHHKEYKSPPGDQPWGIGYDYTHAQNAEIIGKWKTVAGDLVTQIEGTGAIGAAPIFLSSPALDNAFTISLDHALREELRARGYILASTPDPQSFKMQVSTYDPEFKDNMMSYDYNDKLEGNPESPKQVTKDIVIQVEGLIDGVPVTIVEAYHADLPLYGYQDQQRYFPLAQSIAEVWR